MAAILSRASLLATVVKRPRSPITIHPPQREGDRDALIRALAAALVAIARQEAVSTGAQQHMAEAADTSAAPGTTPHKAQTA